MTAKEKFDYQHILALIVFCLCLALALPVQAAKNDEPVTTVILVRHGQTDYNKENRYQGFLDIPLNEKGLAQADQLAASLKDVHIDVFIASPLKRAYVTTEKCAKAKGMEISYTDERLKEINYGKWAGRSKKEIAETEPKASRLWQETPWKTRPPEGESLQELAARYRASLDDAVRRYPGKTIFIGAHSKGNMALLCNVLGIGLEHYLQFEQDNTCANVLKYKNGQWKLVLMNSISHTGKLYKGQNK